MSYLSRLLSRTGQIRRIKYWQAYNFGTVLVSLSIIFQSCSFGNVNTGSISIANFDSGILTEQGGSYTQHSDGESRVSYFLQRGDRHSKAGRCLKIAYDHAATGACEFRVNLYNEDDRPDARRGVDTSPYPLLSFWIKGESGGEDATIELADRGLLNNDASRPGGVVSDYIEGPITTEWQEVIIPYENFGLPTTYAGRVIFNFDQQGTGIIYIDDIKFKQTAEGIRSAAKTPESTDHVSGSGSSAKSKKTPKSYNGDLIPIWNFDEGLVTDQNGYYNHFAAGGSEATLHLLRNTGRGPGGRSLKVKYNKVDSGYCGLWLHLFDDEDDEREVTHIDVSKHATLSFWVKGQSGGEEFMIQMADPIWLDKEDSKPGGLVSRFLKGPITTEWQEVVVPYEYFKLYNYNASCLVFNFTEEGHGTVFIDDINFKRNVKTAVPVSDTPPRVAGDSRPLVRAMWVWKVDPLLSLENYRAEFFEFCQKMKVNEIFLQIPYKFINDLTVDVECEIMKPAELRAFIKEARNRGIKSHALDGYPEFVLTDHHPRVLAQVRALVDFNNNGSQAERFYGIHLDNEPYQLLGFNGPAGHSILRQFFDLNQKIMDLLKARASDLVYGIDIPFWFDEAKDHDGNLKHVLSYNGKTQDAARHLIDIVDNIGIMDYRNFAGGADGMVKHGQDEVRYANKVGKKVYLGVETFKYDPTDISFIYVSQGRNGNSQDDSENPFSMSSTVDSFHVRSIDTPRSSLIGLAHSQNLRDRLDVNSSLGKLFAVFGAHRYDTQTDLGDVESAARDVIRGDGRFDGFSPFLLERSGGELLAAGFDTTENMLSKITFAGKTKSEMEEVLEEVADAFWDIENFLGFAIHYYETYKALPD